MYMSYDSIVPTSVPSSGNVVKTIVVAGAGFAGTSLVRALEKHLPAQWRIILISEESYIVFNSMLAEVVDAGVFPEHVIAPVREMLSTARFIMGRIHAIDAAQRTLQCETLAGTQSIHYDHLVLAFGQRANLNIIPGLAQHALPLKLVGDAMYIRNRILQRLARIELTQDAAERRSLGHFVVIGGGFSGVEVAGAMADFIRSAKRFYPFIDSDDTRVTLLHDGQRLLPELPSPLGDATARSLCKRGVDLRLGARATQVDERHVTLEDTAVLATDTVICTIGARRNPLAEGFRLQMIRGRMATDPDGKVSGQIGLWALGDCAAVPNGLDGAICPPTAQFAVAQAGQLAANLLATIQGKSTKPFHYRSCAMMATTGHLKGVAQVFGVQLTGLSAWLLWRAYYLLMIPTLGRKLRIWVEWTWAMFFPLDITHLRFTHTGEIDPPLEAKNSVTTTLTL